MAFKCKRTYGKGQQLIFSFCSSTLVTGIAETNEKEKERDCCSTRQAKKTQKEMFWKNGEWTAAR
jgi:hypothetical protein